MTVMQSYSLSLTYTSLRTYVQAAPASVPTSSDTQPAPASDTVTLSPEATSAPAETPQPPAETPQPPAAPPSRAAQRAEVLLNALDADQDGAVTKEEFLDGAMALLRRAGARHHHRHHRLHDEHHDRGHEGHGMRRLEKRLDRLFERVDDSGDGSLDRAELTDALNKVTREPRTPPTETPAPPAQETPSQTALSYTSVTVMIAVKQYSSVAGMTS